MNIQNMTEEELNSLEKEIQNKKEELKKIKIEEKKKLNYEKIKYLQEHKDIILPLFRHNRASCSNSNPCNANFAYPDDGCPKCQLIEIANGNWGNSYEVNFSFEIKDICD